MERSNEVILQNAILENVLRYLFDKLKGISGKTIETMGDDGTIYAYYVQNVFPSNSNKIEVKYTSVITPQGNVEKAHGYWGDLIAMSFEGLQLQTNTVLIKAECKHPFIVSIFDRYWDDMLKDFGALQPVHSRADNNESGPTIITGGALNPVYHAEFEQGVAIKPEGQVDINHNMENFQLGSFLSQAKKLEAYIENAALDNVLIYINDEIKEKGFDSYTLDNGAIYTWTLRARLTPEKRVPFGRGLTADIPHRTDGRIIVGGTYTIERSGKLIEKDDFVNVMAFSGWQRTNDRVKLVGELYHESDFIRERFYSIWGSTLKEFKADGQATQVSAGEPEILEEFEDILKQIGFEDKTGWDMTLIALWNQGQDRAYIASRVYKSPERVTNRISELRRMLGKDGEKVLPKEKERKRQRINSRYRP